MVYTCLPGRHDDLGISCAMLAWAARHPHLQSLGRQRSIGRATAAPAAAELRLGSVYVSVARDGVPRGDANIARLLGVRGLHSLKTLRAGGMAGCWPAIRHERLVEILV